VSILTAYLADRGGREPFLGQFTGPTEIRWQRVRDDVSVGSVHVRDASVACSTLLSQAEAVRHELVIMQGKDRIWEGPITLVDRTGPTGKINARDMMFFTQRTVAKTKWSSAHPLVETHVQRTLRILKAEMQPWDAAGARFLQGLHPIQKPDDARTTRVSEKYAQYVWDDIEALAARSGMDYTVVGRTLYLHDTHQPIARGRTLTDSDFLAELRVVQYGSELSTTYYVTDNLGRAKASKVPDTYYGPVELLAAAYDQGTATVTTIPDAELQLQASRNIRSRYPVPKILRVPENSLLRPNVVGDLMPYLIPGVQFMVSSSSMGTRAESLQKLDRVEGIEDASGYRVSVSLSPAPLGAGNEEDVPTDV
jgi:hypothetical protein